MLPPFDGPKVVTFHDLSIQKFPEFHPRARVDLLERQMRLAVDSGAHIITNAYTTRAEVEAYYGLPGDRVSAVHLGVDDQFYPRSKAECENTLKAYGLRYREFFLFVSSIRKLPLKMHSELIGFSAIMKRWRRTNEKVQIQ